MTSLQKQDGAFPHPFENSWLSRDRSADTVTTTVVCVCVVCFSPRVVECFVECPRGEWRTKRACHFNNHGFGRLFTTLLVVKLWESFPPLVSSRLVILVVFIFKDCRAPWSHDESYQHFVRLAIRASQVNQKRERNKLLILFFTRHFCFNIWREKTFLDVSECDSSFRSLQALNPFSSKNKETNFLFKNVLKNSQHF